MNRREMFKTVAGAAAAGGVVVDRVTAVSAEPAPVFAVLEASGCISDHARKYLRETLAESFKGTPFEHVKVLVLGDGLKLTFLDRHGRICNEQITDGKAGV